MTREELIDHLEHLERYTHYSEHAPALREVIEMLKCSEMPNISKDFFWKNARKNALKYTETHACDCVSRQAIRPIDQDPDTEHHREFIKLIIRNSIGRPYFSIIYLEFDDNGVGHEFEGYSSYSLDVISDYLKKYFMPPTQPESIKCDVRKKDEWIPCSERMPECEQEVLICTKKKIYISKNSGLEWYEEPIITPALYEDGTMLEVNSKWRWEDIDYAGWDEEEDCGIIPEGWWENRHFNPDDVYNNLVDKEVIAWMPLPEPYQKEEPECANGCLYGWHSIECEHCTLKDSREGGRRMSRLDDAISNVAYILDSLMVLRSIYQTGHHCNDCGNRNCGYAPKPGQQIRYNCPLWRAKDEA